MREKEGLSKSRNYFFEIRHGWMAIDKRRWKLNRDEVHGICNPFVAKERVLSVNETENKQILCHIFIFGACPWNRIDRQCIVQLTTFSLIPMIINAANTKKSLSLSLWVLSSKLSIMLRSPSEVRRKAFYFQFVRMRWWQVNRSWVLEN